MERAGAPVSEVRRQLRVLAILRAGQLIGHEYMRGLQLHAAAYFSDALAPVWGLQILEAQRLKRSGGPTSPPLQRDVDRLVGLGVVTATSVTHTQDSDGAWRIDADYSLNEELADPILDRAERFSEFAEEFRYVREVMYALSGLGALGPSAATSADASYGNPLVDLGGMVNLRASRDVPNETARVALRFDALLDQPLQLSDAEKVHLYVRHLYARASR